MANGSTDINTNSSTVPVIPEYLDFNTLRSNSIEYLGELTGKLWTDYNEHDPGITILEMLCYAMLDLNYRTKFPVADIMARDPSDSSSDNNFFTPANILGCNPLTITDYRKLLIDIEGVKNAWFEIDKDNNPRTICKSSRSSSSSCGDGSIEFINGLYHVSIELDDGYESSEKQELVLENVKKSLSGYRNLCEDFINIFVLCKFTIGVCADIELELNADPEQVYEAMILALQNFFSPSPKFYKLQDLLSKPKCKHIEDIFTGRPYDITQSHGFVDIDEFEQIKLKKEIHLSDVYNVIKVDGVKTVRQLTLQKCENGQVTPMAGWKIQLPENYIPDFSLDCSGFRFTQNKKVLSVDFSKFELAYKLNFASNTKVLYQQPSPYLDLAVPKGIYRSDLGDYYSIQNEFPRVYGIAQGGLPADATKLRQAQALQLKGYLLFFDQLLADYLVQLKSIRELFSFTTPDDTAGAHTYFPGRLNTVPGLEKLLRFSTGDNGQTIFGEGGSPLGIPVIPKDKGKFPAPAINDPSIVIDPATQLQAYTSPSAVGRDVALQQLLNDISNGNFRAGIFSTKDGCYFFYIDCTDFAIMSKAFFDKVADATQALANIIYLASFKENYRSFSNADNNFSFDIEFNAAGYINYLQVLLENKSAYRDRREAFLNHLLSRFAEKFTDYALLSYGFLNAGNLTNTEIKNKEIFLSNYPELSSNRGKGFNYPEDGWNCDNISGFEKRFKALTGIENQQRHNLCNFEVVHCDRNYTLQLNIAGYSFFRSDAKYDNREEASLAIVDLFEALGDYRNYEVAFNTPENDYRIQVKYGQTRYASYPKSFPDEMSAKKESNNIYHLFSGNDLGDNIIVSKKVYKQQLFHSGELVRVSKDIFHTASDAYTSFLKSAKKINDAGRWDFPTQQYNIGSLYGNKNENGHDQVFIDLSHFKIDINNNIIGKPDKFGYDVLDTNNNFKFSSTKEFENEALAKADCRRLLLLMTNEKNHVPVPENDRWKIHIIQNDSVQAESTSSFKTEPDAIDYKEKILKIVAAHKYSLVVPDAFDYRWKFNYPLGYENGHILIFQSIDEYNSKSEALEAARLFAAHIDEIIVSADGKLSLRARENKKIPVCSIVPTTTIKVEKKETTRNKANGFLELRKAIKSLSEKADPEAFKDTVLIDEVNKHGEYIYRLVDKDHILAKSTDAAPTEQEAKTLRNTLSSNFEKGYDFLEICLGGDVVIERIDKTGTWYHYVIRCRSKIFLLKEDDILFKSYMGYPSKQEAEDAFNQDYLIILTRALEQNNYGSGKFISVEETFSEQNDSCIKSDTIAVVPKETYRLFGTYDDQVVRELIRIANCYPLRMILKNPLTPTTRPVKTSCKKAAQIFVYSFSLFDAGENKTDWVSTSSYDTVDEARQEFYFFLLLLSYKGNYHIDFDYSQCKYVVYIREVLAESNRRFTTEKDAWGSEGVEKFICVAQSGSSFHNFFDRKICCDSFYISCENAALIHPCTYESAEKRNEALELLYATGREFIDKNPLEVFFPHDSNIVRDLDGKELAEFIRQDTKKNFSNYCCHLLELIDCILDDRNYKKDDEGFFLACKPPHSNEKMATPVDKNMSLKEWKEKLFQLAYYFPVTKKTDENNQDTFCVEIRFPNLNIPATDFPNDEPCGCNGSKSGTKDVCYVSWKSSCCFNTCQDAFEFYFRVLLVLRERNNYRAAYDCACGPYRIELYSNQDIVALNPQCYNTPAMNCEAVDRAKKLLNAEGLHLVEHILLRPNCEEDCTCAFHKNPHENNTHCNFTWEIPGEQDPCNEQKNICFVPGSDPYSFIATVALPAWPERFRKKENRQLLESILQREMPAHILLRILWLAPHDLCCFETYFRTWNRWLAKKNTDACKEKNPTCEFLNFLFERDFGCLNDCIDCAPCKTEAPPASPCFSQDGALINPTDDYEMLNQVNELFGWKIVDCAKYKYLECEDTLSEKQVKRSAKTKPREEKKSIHLKEASQSEFIKDRLSLYKQNAEIIVSGSDNAATAEVTRFLSHRNPSMLQYRELMLLILESKRDTSKKIKGLSAQNKNVLINNLTRYFLDKQVFIKNGEEKLAGLKEFFDQMRNKKIDVQVIYDDWQAEAVKEYVPNLNVNAIKSLMGVK